MAFGFKLSTGGKEGPRDTGETCIGGGSHVSVTASCYGRLSPESCASLYLAATVIRVSDHHCTTTRKGGGA